MKIYIIGALKNPAIPEIANKLSAEGHTTFADWYSPGPEADQCWQAYERTRGRGYREAVYGPHSVHAFEFDKHYLDACDAAVMVMPAGKSGHLELGYAAGKGKRTFVLFDGEPDRFDLMYLLAERVVFSVEELIEELVTTRVRAHDWKAGGFR